MKRPKIPALPAMPEMMGIGIPLLIGLAWFLFMSYVNTRTMTYQVQVAGSVDEVSFYKATHPETPVKTIITNGEDTVASVELTKGSGFSFVMHSEPAQYYFVTKQGEASFQSSVICCKAGLEQTHASLEIRGLQEWKQFSP